MNAVVFVLFATLAAVMAEQSPENPDYNKKGAVTFGIVGLAVIIVVAIASLVQRHNNHLSELEVAKQKKIKMDAIAAKTHGATEDKGSNPIRGSMGINK